MEDFIVIVVDPSFVTEFKKLIDRIEQYVTSLSQAFLDAMDGIEDLAERIKSIFEECQAEEQQNKLKYGSFDSSCICLVSRRLDMVLWYTSGFRSCRLPSECLTNTTRYFFIANQNLKKRETLAKR